MAHECAGCGDDCACIEGDIVERNCIGCGECDDILDDEDDDMWDDEDDA